MLVFLFLLLKLYLHVIYYFSLHGITYNCSSIIPLKILVAHALINSLHIMSILIRYLFLALLWIIFPIFRCFKRWRSSHLCKNKFIIWTTFPLFFIFKSWAWAVFVTHYQILIPKILSFLKLIVVSFDITNTILLIYPPFSSIC